MADQEETSGRKRARGDEDEHRFQLPLRRIAGELFDKTGAPVSQRDLENLKGKMPLWLWEKYLNTITTSCLSHTDGEKEEETDEKQHEHRLMIEETHGEQGGAGNQEAEEEHDRSTRTRKRIRGASSPSPDRGVSDQAVPDWNDEQASSDVDREAESSEAGPPWREGQLQHSSGGNEINPSHGEGSAGNEVEKERAVRHQEGELVPISSKTRTKTTTTKTTTKKNGTAINTVTKTTTKVSRKRFERR